MAFKLDIFTVLGELAKGNMDYYASLDEELKKSVSPFVLMKWARGATIAQDLHVILLNRYVNPYIFALGSEPELLWMLLCVAMEEPGCRYKWLDTKQASTKKPISLKLVKQYYEYGDIEAKDALRLLSVDDLLEIGEDCGIGATERTKLKKEWK
jgi:hypothetical protein